MRYRIVVVLGIVLATIASTMVAAIATPSARGFGPVIEGPSGYEGQSKCSPWAKPGVVAFQQMTLRAYPGTGAGGIERACNVGGQSEHKEGRAWDWSVNVGVPHQKAAADSMIKWLTSDDRFGNEAAMARRLGVMYIIWNRKIWFPWGGWETYCVQKSWGCHSPGERDSLRHPHTDHVHFSFTRAGAMKKTSYWHKDMSFVASGAASTTGKGLWLLGRNGSVSASNVGFYGSKPFGSSKRRAVAIASTPTGGGYWVVTKDGRLSAFGDAPYKGGARDATDNAVAMASTPSGRGYWVLTGMGKPLAFGDAVTKGRPALQSPSAVGIASSATGRGYWIVTRNGGVSAFGDAPSLGGLEGSSNVKGIVATPNGLGYWLYTSSGRVAAFGEARKKGDLSTRATNQEVVALARTPSGGGYWLVGSRGKVRGFGDATRLGADVTFARPLDEALPAGISPSLVFGD